MTSYAESRRELHDELLGVLSQQSAAFLMDSVPLAPFSDIARKGDVDNSVLLLRGDMDSLRTEQRGEIGALGSELRTEMGELRTELRGEIGALGSELRTEMGELRTELRTEMEVRFSHVERQFGNVERQFGEMGLQIARVERSIAELQLALTFKMQQQFIAQLALVLAVVATMGGVAFFG